MAQTPRQSYEVIPARTSPTRIVLLMPSPVRSAVRSEQLTPMMPWVVGFCQPHRWGPPAHMAFVPPPTVIKANSPLAA